MYRQHHPSSWTTLPPPFHHEHTSVLPSPPGDHDSFHLPPPPATPSPSSLSSHGGLFKRVVDGLQFAYEGSTTSTPPLTNYHLGFQMVQHGSDPPGIHAETGKMTAQEIVDAKTVAASKSHSEAERRRRERINNHLTRLRSLLPSTTKTDKASLLAEVIQHVKDLKRQHSIIAEQSLIPTEIDELTIDNTSDEEGKIVIKASLCCEDRSDLLPDLIKTLKMLRLRTLKAEMTTLGRRVKNVLFVTGEEYHSSSNNVNEQMVNHWINTIEEALKAVVEKTENEDYSSFGISVKRQRTNNIDLI
ncbi:hypothetical protein L2E82_08293 [Cichorium intybus]|uniref:Uncharacterized protein n=1 Tax=Cichorium intybus TaxID=13427 RepID=A0ACB9G5V6_CICIN|nr:hypothetical protein L2E82_08293 [Cichorium intybus]